VRSARIALCAALLITAACAPPHRGGAGSTAGSPGLPDQPVAIDRLYFGRNAGDTLAVSDSAWTAFLADVVTPRFPDGLTAWRAEGAWRGPDGVLEHEPSFVLELVHPPGRGGDDRAVREIIAAYKHRFHQQSVLRVEETARAAF